MIQVTIGNNLDRNRYNIELNTTLRDALEMANVDYSTGTLSLDGASLRPGDLNKTFAEFGYSPEAGHNRASLICVVKADNAH